ncbi:unnamed protein product, partial [marine sediment metagenome]
MAYNTISIDSGEDPKLEQEMMKLVKSDKVTLPKPKIKPPTSSSLKGISKAKRKRQPPSSKSSIPQPPKIPELPQSSMPSVTPEIPPSSQGPVFIDARPLLQSAKETVPSDVLAELQNMKIPLGYEREAVIIGKLMYTIIETKQSVFGKTIEGTEIRKMDSPPDGVYLALDT